MRRHLTAALLLGASSACAAHPTLREENPTMPTSQIESNKQLVRALYEDCFNQGRLAQLERLVSADYVGPAGERGPEGARGVVQGLRDGMSDLRFTLDDVIAEGDRVVVRWHFTGTHDGVFRGIPATGKSLTNTGIVIYQVRNGQLVHSTNEVDRLGMLQQMGVVPQQVGPATARPTRP